MKNPLIIFGIIGIVVGFVLQATTGNSDFLSYGLIGGLLLGFLMDSKNRSGSTSKPGNQQSGMDLSDLFNRPSSSQQSDDTTVQPSSSQTVDSASSASTGERSRVSRVDDSKASDVIARAREEIAKNTKDNN